MENYENGKPFVPWRNRRSLTPHGTAPVQPSFLKGLQTQPQATQPDGPPASTPEISLNPSMPAPAAPPVTNPMAPQQQQNVDFTNMLPFLNALKKRK